MSAVPNVFDAPDQPKPILRPVQALVLHEGSDGNFGGTQYLLTAHCMRESDSGPLIGEGRILGLQEKKALIQILLGELKAADDGFLPPEVIASGSGQLSWWVPAQRRAMYFRIGKRSIRLQVPWPALLFRVTDDAVAVTALSSSQRPGAGTRLYHAPLMNIDAATILCNGSAALPQGMTLDDRARYEAVVYDTSFSHVGHEHTLRVPEPKGTDTEEHLQFWRVLHNKKTRCFPRKFLVPLKLTTEQWLRRAH